MPPLPTLLVLNGPPGVGKSTLARRYVEDHPLALALDVDVVRSLLGRWRDHEHDAGLAAPALALGMARTHLEAGHDVVVPQLLARPAFLEALERLAADTAARFVEVVLWDTKENALARFRSRPGAVHVVDPGDAALAAFHDRLAALLPSRPKAIVLDNPDGAVDETYRALLDRL